MVKKAPVQNRLLMCHGVECKLLNKKHRAIDLIDSPRNKSKRFCKPCFDKEMEENRQKQMLEATICRIFEIPSLGEKGNLLKTQVKRLQDKGYTTKNIRLSLEYFVNVKQEKVTKSKGIGIVPYIHDEMIEYHKNKLAKSTSTQALDVGVTKIKMNYPKRRYNHKEAKLINLEELANGIKNNS